MQFIAIEGTFCLLILRSKLQISLWTTVKSRLLRNNGRHKHYIK